MTDALLIVILTVVILVFLSLIPIFYLTFRDYFSRLSLNKFNSNFKNTKNNKIDSLIEQLLDAVNYFKQKKIGCLIVLSRSSNLNNLITDEGVEINGNLSSDLIKVIFTCKEIQLHDGALLINQDWQITSCSVFFRVKKTFKPLIKKPSGTRHLVATQIAFDSNAAVIVVSETTGEITYIHNKKLTFKDIELETLRQKLKEDVYDE